MTKMRTPPQSNWKASLPTQVPKGKSPQNLLTQPPEVTPGPDERETLHLLVLEELRPFWSLECSGIFALSDIAIKGTVMPSGRPRTLLRAPSQHPSSASIPRRVRTPG